MRAIFNGTEYVVEEITSVGIAHGLINHVGYMTHVGPIPSLHLGYSTTPQVYQGDMGLYVTAVRGPAQFINWIAQLTPVDEVVSRLRSLLA
jgi:hypothetical protein